MTCGIYVIKNVEDGKLYVGKSINIEKRWKEHVRSLIAGNHRNNYLQHVYNLLGLEIFEHKIIEECEKENLNERELFYVLKFKSKVPNGYNLTDGGDGIISPSDETRERLVKSKLGEKNPMFGKTASDETLKKMSQSMIGKNKGKHHSEETKAYLRTFVGEKASGFGKPRTEKFKEKLSKERMGTLNPSFGIKRIGLSSEYYGVCFDKHHEKWRVDVVFNNKKYYIGSFNVEEDAARAYDSFIIENNFPHHLNFSDYN